MILTSISTRRSLPKFVLALFIQTNLEHRRASHVGEKRKVFCLSGQQSTTLWTPPTHRTFVKMATLPKVVLGYYMVDGKEGKQETHLFTFNQGVRMVVPTIIYSFWFLFPLGLRTSFTSSFILTRQSVTYTQDSSSIGLESWFRLSKFPLDRHQYTVSFNLGVGKALSY